MTREQAIDILDRTTSVGDRISAAYWIDIFVALGMLKLDEPKGVEQRLAEAYAGQVSLTPTGLKCRLDAAGLKIVEK